MITVYGDKASGNCLKVKYVADLLSIPCEWKDVSVLRGETRLPEFLTLNPAGQVPIIQLADGRTLSQSNAIMRYLAEDSALIPGDSWQRAKMDEWLCWEQYSHEPAIAVTRFHVVYQGRALEARDESLVTKGEAALDRMETHLTGANWFAGDAISLADIALFAYTQFAPEAGFDLSSRQSIKRWLTVTSSALRENL